MPLDTRLDIPPVCFEVKPNYPTQPGRELIREIKQFIARTGDPHLWRDHTHSPPLPGDKPVYLDEFELPEIKRKLKYFAPCPCCSPRNRKFGYGKITWFPIECVIRMLGPECFAALDAEGHADAIAEMRARKHREAEVAFLLNSGDRLRAALEIINEAIPVATAIHRFGKSLRRVAETSLDLPLWSHLRHGELKIWEEASVIDGRSTMVRVQTQERVYARITGYKILQPTLKDHSFHLEQAVKSLRLVGTDGDWADHVQNLSERDRRQTALLINKAISSSQRIFSELRDRQQFVSPVTVATLRTWGLLPESVLPFIFSRQDNIIKMGKTESGVFSVPIPKHFEDEIPHLDLPLLSEFQET